MNKGSKESLEKCLYVLFNEPDQHRRYSLIKIGGKFKLVDPTNEQEKMRTDELITKIKKMSI